MKDGGFDPNLSPWLVRLMPVKFVPMISRWRTQAMTAATSSTSPTNRRERPAAIVFGRPGAAAADVLACSE
jgi:hypothetical protein